MQTDDNRLSQKGSRIGELSDAWTIAQAREAVADALILQPKIRAADLAEAMLNNAYDFQPELNGLLARNFYIAACHAERRRQSAAARAQLLLPGFDHLPLRITVAKGRRIALLSANREGVRAYYWALMKRHTERKRRDPRIIEAKKLLDVMTKRAHADKRITVREVVLLDG